MFRSLSKELFGTQCHHLELRKLISHFEEHNPSISLFANCEPQLHLERIRREMVWGSATELIAIASMLQAPVFTYTRCLSQNYSWHKYAPLQLEKLTFHNPALKVLAKRFAKASYHIELLHHSECLYDRVVSVSDQPASLPVLSGEVCPENKAVIIE